MGINRREVIGRVWRGLLASQLPASARAAAGEQSSGRTASAWRLPERQAVKQIENQWIPYAANARVAARLWLPEAASTRPVPVVMEYIPYRKRDTTRDVDDVTGRYLAERGIAFARVDVPGSGDSDGVLRDEYLEPEQRACLTVIAWLAEQPWCTGAVGMRGYSWGAQSALQAAMQNPPALKAIMPFCSSDHRFLDDAHWIGGALGWVNFQWASFFKGVQCSPPDPALVGSAWREMWLARLRASGTIAAIWTRHQRDDAYWRNGDASADYSRIRCPVYAVGGLVDAYTDTIPRLLQNLRCHRQALIGPWGHGYPEFANPGPGLDWGYEEVRWWRHWLCGDDTGIQRAPALRIYMPDATASQVYPLGMPGRWMAEPLWPPATPLQREYWFLPAGLGASPAGGQTAVVPSAGLVGLGHPEWLPFYQDVDLPREQSPDDALSLAFDSPILVEDLRLLGTPVARLAIASNRPVAQVAVRLTEVLPDGQSWMVSYGLLNLCHRTGGAHPIPLAPGEFYDVEVPLRFHAHRFKKGNRIRVAVSPSSWPLVWGPPEPVVLTLQLERCRLTLPAATATAWDLGIDSLPLNNPVSSGVTLGRHDGPGPGQVELRKAWPVDPTLVTGASPPDPLATAGTRRFEGWTRAILAGAAGDPNAGFWRIEFEEIFQRGQEWDCRIEVGIELRADAQRFHVTEWIRAYDGGKPIHESRHETPVARRLV